MHHKLGEDVHHDDVAVCAIIDSGTQADESIGYKGNEAALKLLVGNLDVIWF